MEKTDRLLLMVENLLSSYKKNIIELENKLNDTFKKRIIRLDFSLSPFISKNKINTFAIESINNLNIDKLKNWVFNSYLENNIHIFYEQKETCNKYYNYSFCKRLIKKKKIDKFIEEMKITLLSIINLAKNKQDKLPYLQKREQEIFFKVFNSKSKEAFIRQKLKDISNFNRLLLKNYNDLSNNKISFEDAVNNIKTNNFDIISAIKQINNLCEEYNSLCKKEQYFELLTNKRI